MEHPYVYGAGDRSRVLRQQAVHCLAPGKAHTMDPDVVRKLSLTPAPVEDVHVVGHLEFATYRVLGIVVALDVENPNAARTQAIQFSGQEGGSAGAALGPVEEVAGDQQGCRLLGKRGIDNA